MHVCVIEDDKLLRSLYSELFNRHQIELTQYENGREALHQLSQTTHLPDIIVVDYLMPVMDGFAFRRHQLTDEKLKPIPCILVSAYTNTNDNEVAMPHFNEYLTKPVPFRVLQETIEKVLFDNAQDFKRTNRSNELGLP